MIERATVLEKIEIIGDDVMVRWGKRLIEGNTVIASEPHRSSFPKGVDVERQIANVNAHLGAMTPSYPPVSSEDAERIKAIYAAL